ncbi:MAG: hypothetical protein B6D65_03220 [candidate division Zixibacteria bacterium 4484_93]|nr:MAG: hypothetical protein B6D65_03220 [candidate division Zixibacteria bacterium 4484_93]
MAQVKIYRTDEPTFEYLFPVLPELPTVIDFVANIRVQKTDSGVVQTYKLGETQRVFHLRFIGMSEDEFSPLLQILAYTISGGAVSFYLDFDDTLLGIPVFLEDKPIITTHHGNPQSFDIELTLIEKQEE